MRHYQSQFSHGLMFHRLCNNKKNVKVPGTLTKKNFEDIIKFVNPKRILDPLIWLDKLNKNQLKKNDLCLTFDDGLSSQKKIALPVMKKYGLKAFWFIHTQSFYKKYDHNEIFIQVIFNQFKSFKTFFDEFKVLNKFDSKFFKNKKFLQYFVIQKKYCKNYSLEEVQYRFLRDHYYVRKNFERLMIKFFKNKKINLYKENKKIWLTKNDITYLCKNNHVIGMHSFTHPPKISKLSYKEQENEYRKNYKTLKLICNKEISSMSHPMNSYNHDTFKILKKMGIVCGFKADMLKEHSLKNNNKNLAIKRIDARELLNQIY